MKACKDCLYYDMCLFGACVNGAAGTCPNFNDKSEWVHIPCKVGDTVYVIVDCSMIFMHHDNDYFTGTGAIECPFEDVCSFTECDDENTQVLKTYVRYIWCDDFGEWNLECKKIGCGYTFNDFGKTIFFTREEAEKALERKK